MFNRLAICNAYYMFATLYHGGQYSKEYAYFGRLDKLGYKPGLGASSHDPDRLDEESRKAFNRLVEEHERPKREQAERERVEQLSRKTFNRATRILEAAQPTGWSKNIKHRNSSNTTKNSDDWRIRNVLDEIQLHCNGYAEPGYTDPDCRIVATGNWNDIIVWNDGQRCLISNIPSRIAKLFAKLGIPTEWCDEWVNCSHCGKLLRTEPDCMHWTPSYTMGDGELWCHECDEPDDSSDEDSDD